MKLKRLEYQERQELKRLNLKVKRFIKIKRYALPKLSSKFIRIATPISILLVLLTLLISRHVLRLPFANTSQPINKNNDISSTISDPLTPWTQIINNSWKYSYFYPTTFKTYSQIIQSKDKTNLNAGIYYSPDTQFNSDHQVTKGLALSTDVVTDQTTINRLSSKDITKVFPNNQVSIDNSLIPKDLTLPKGVTANVMIIDDGKDPQTIIVNFFRDFQGNKNLVQLSCKYNLDECKVLIPELISRFKLTN